MDNRISLLALVANHEIADQSALTPNQARRMAKELYELAEAGDPRLGRTTEDAVNVLYDLYVETKPAYHESLSGSEKCASLQAILERSTTQSEVTE